MRTVAAVLLLAIYGCATQPAQVRYWDLSLYTDGGLRGTSGITLDDPDTRRIRDVAQRVQAVASPRPFADVYIIDSNDHNAFAGDHNGRYYVAITLPMARLLGADRDAIAHLFGHEFAHHLRRHRQARTERESIRAGLSSVAGVVLQIAGIPFGSSLADVSSQVITSAYSRDEERQADDDGFGYATAAGYEAVGGVRLFEKLQSVSSGFAIPFLATHPSSTERTQNMVERAATASTVSSRIVVRAAPVGPDFASQEERRKFERAVAQAHPKWSATIRSAPFREWIVKLPLDTQRLGASQDSTDMILLLDMYERMSK